MGSRFKSGVVRDFVVTWNGNVDYSGSIPLITTSHIFE